MTQSVARSLCGLSAPAELLVQICDHLQGDTRLIERYIYVSIAHIHYSSAAVQLFAMFVNTSMWELQSNIL